MTRIARIQNGRASAGPGTPESLFSQKTTRFRLASEGLRRGRQREQRLSFAENKRSLRCLRFLLFKNPSVTSAVPNLTNFPRKASQKFTQYPSERPEMNSHGEKPKKATRKKIKIMNNIKRISLMTAIFLTVALASFAVEAGVIRINGTIAGSESGAPFPNPAEGVYVNGSVTSTDTHLGPFTLSYSLVVDFAFLDIRPGQPGASRLVVGDAANGDSILTCFFGNNAGLCANG